MGEGQITAPEVMRLGTEVADKLAFCHESGILHRNLKPQNVFVDVSGHFELGDFGVSRLVEGVTSTLSQKNTSIYGSPLLMQNQGDAKFGVYALDAMLYKPLNANRLPFNPPAPEPITMRNR